MSKNHSTAIAKRQVLLLINRNFKIKIIYLINQLLPVQRSRTDKMCLLAGR